jgi:hypothetical protein
VTNIEQVLIIFYLLGIFILEYLSNVFTYKAPVGYKIKASYSLSHRFGLEDLKAKFDSMLADSVVTGRWTLARRPTLINKRFFTQGVAVFIERDLPSIFHRTCTPWRV